MHLMDLPQLPECPVKDLLTRLSSSLLFEVLEGLGTAAVLDEAIDGPSRAGLIGELAIPVKKGDRRENRAGDRTEDTGERHHRGYDHDDTWPMVAPADGERDPGNHERVGAQQGSGS